MIRYYFEERLKFESKWIFFNNVRTSIDISVSLLMLLILILRQLKMYNLPKTYKRLYLLFFNPYLLVKLFLNEGDKFKNN